ncbi:MAG: phage tail protein, partial [Mucilaginibacter sp.]|uniref:phage tail protein n=1 Tax=Mucilaginibacter sp. TaxID=1882438 RepID=UPI003267BA6A
MITIYQAGTNAVRQIVNPLANSQQEQGVMGKDIVTINCSLPFAVNFGIGDYATVFDSLYKINVPPVLQKISGRNYQYTITLEGRIGDLGKTQFLFLDADNNFTESEFPLRARLIDFADFLLANIKRRYPDDPEYPIKNWQISGVQDTDFKDLTFSRNNCLDALNYAIKEFDTEYSLDGTKIYLYKRQPASGVLLRYGAGLYGLTRQPLDNGNIVNLLYAYGSDKNIGSDYRG